MSKLTREELQRRMTYLTEPFGDTLSPEESERLANIIEAFRPFVGACRGELTAAATASRLAKEFSQPDDADAERKLYEAFCSIPEILARQIPFLLQAERIHPSASAILFLVRELDYALKRKMKIGDAEVVEDAAQPMYYLFLSMPGHRRNPDLVESGTLPRQKVERELSATMDSDDASVVELFADLGTENLDRDAAFDWAMRALRHTADKFQEIVIERRKLLANVAVVERRIDRTQQETVRILSGLIKG